MPCSADVAHLDGRPQRWTAGRPRAGSYRSARPMRAWSRGAPQHDPYPVLETQLLSPEASSLRHAVPRRSDLDSPEHPSLQITTTPACSAVKDFAAVAESLVSVGHAPDPPPARPALPGLSSVFELGGGVEAQEFQSEQAHGPLESPYSGGAETMFSCTPLSLRTASRIAERSWSRTTPGHIENWHG
jgi:hypothetical protein